MKKIFIIILTLLVYTTLYGQAPESFKYQAVLRDARGNIKANTSADISIDILEGGANGATVYSESHKVTTDSYGLINFEIGKGSAKAGKISSINWGAGVYFVKVSIDGVSMGTGQLLSVPYALYAEKSANGFSGDYNDLLNKPVIFDGTWSSLSGKPVLAPVAISGDYNDLINKPAASGTVTLVSGTAPIKVISGSSTPVVSMSQGNGTTSGYLSSSDWTTFNNKSSFDGTWTGLSGKPVLATVASTGSYNDLVNKPTGSNPGDMKYWNGSAWVMLPPGQPGQFLQMSAAGIPSWTTAAIPVSSWMQSQVSWINSLESNSISSPESLLDNNATTKGGLSMSYYSTTYTKVLYLDFGASKTIDGFRFTFEFPNCKQGKCSGYPTDIDYNCLGNLYYKNSSGQWVSAYTCPKLNTKKSDQGCPMTDTYSTTFSGISAREWKFEMIGNYWLGGSYQTTTNFMIKDIEFRNIQ